ncbi:MAG: hypothetical protein V1648_02310 [Candidatus Aenigmatarchaeota archaeon]
MTASGFKYIVPVTIPGKTGDCNGRPCVFFGNWKYPVETDPETKSMFVNMDSKIYPVMERKPCGPGRLYIEVEEAPFASKLTFIGMLAEIEKFLEYSERYVLRTDVEPLLK